jgi:hypothetical protein
MRVLFGRTKCIGLRMLARHGKRGRARQKLRALALRGRATRARHKGNREQQHDQ